MTAIDISSADGEFWVAHEQQPGLPSCQDTASCPATAGKAQSATGFTEILTPYLPFLRRFALRLTRNPADAEDLLQDLLLHLYTHRHKLDEVEVLQPWLARVIYYRFVDRCRRGPPDSVFIPLDQLGVSPGTNDPEGRGDCARELCDEHADPEREAVTAEQESWLRVAVARLPEHQRELVRLHHIEGRSLPEIAELLGQRLSAVHTSLKRARATLRSMLVEHGDGTDGRPPRPKGQESGRPRLVHGARPLVSGQAAPEPPGGDRGRRQLWVVQRRASSQAQASGL